MGTRHPRVNIAAADPYRTSSDIKFESVSAGDFCALVLFLCLLRTVKRRKSNGTDKTAITRSAKAPASVRSTVVPPGPINEADKPSHAIK